MALGVSGNAWKEANGLAAWYLRFDLISSTLPFYEPGNRGIRMGSLTMTVCAESVPPSLDSPYQSPHRHEYSNNSLILLALLLLLLLM